MISIDIETWGLKEGYTLQPWRVETKEAGIMMLAEYCGDVAKVTFFEPEEDDLFFNEKKVNLIVGWNLKFDLAFMLAQFTRNNSCKFKYLDGMLLLKRLYQDLPTYSLKKTLIKFKDKIPNFIEDYSKDIEFKIGSPRNAYTEEEHELMAEYNKRDAIYTWHLIKYLMSIADVATIQQAIRESTAAFHFADSWVNGIYLDQKEVELQASKIETKLAEVNLFLPKVGLSKDIISSPKQLVDFLQTELNIVLTERTEKGTLSASQTVLKNLCYCYDGFQNKILRLILKYKNLQTELNKFITSARACGDVAHPDPMLNSTYTGRVTYSIYHNINTTKTFKNGATKQIKKEIHIGIPIHQMKRGEMRNIVVAPKGYSIVELDFSAQEMRLMACVANEKTMIGLFNDQKDLHAYTAAGIVGMGYEEFQELKKTDPDKYKNDRFIGKLTNLALQYRLSARNLYKQWHDKHGITNKTENDAELAKQAYLRIYSGIGRYWQDVVSFAKVNHYVKNLAGRKHMLLDWTYENAWSAEQTAINFPIQSTGAEQKILALYELRDFISQQGIRFGWDLHDGMYFYVPDCDMQRDLVKSMIEIVENLPYNKAWRWNPQVKFPVEVKIGKAWGKLQSIS